MVGEGVRYDALGGVGGVVAEQEHCSGGGVPCFAGVVQERLQGIRVVGADCVHRHNFGDDALDLTEVAQCVGPFFYCRVVGCYDEIVAAVTPLADFIGSRHIEKVGDLGKNTTFDRNDQYKEC